MAFAMNNETAGIAAESDTPVSGTFLKPALIGGSISATLDLVYAFAAYAPVPPERILQSIASGWFGNAAFALGARSALLGLISHFAILWIAALAYVVGSSRWPRLLQLPWLYGPVYGLLIFAIMNVVVVPLSNASASPPTGWLLFGSVFAHTILVGLSIAVVAARFARRRVV